nr:Gfo/Idh/MocA family oxidoreductase [Candidatus Njordarchaeota archaeon]
METYIPSDCSLTKEIEGEIEGGFLEFVKFGIIGCGAAAEFHSAGMEGVENPNLKFVGCYDVNKETLENFSRAKHIPSYNSMEELLESDIDAALVLVPHHLHAAITKTVAKAGKHVLIEKPMAMTLEQCDEMIADTRKARVRLMIAENHRFLPAHKVIKEAVERGLIGDVFLGRTYEGAFCDASEFLDPDIWHFTYDKGGGGALFDQGPHKMALLNWLLNSEVVSAQCWLGKALPSPPTKGEDSAMVFLRYKNGAMIDVVVSSTTVHPLTNSTELHGTKGSIFEDHSWEPPVRIYSNVPEAEKPCEYYSPQIEHSPFPGYYTIAARVEDTYFADCVINDKEPEFTPQQAKEAVADVYLAYYAAKKGGIATMDELKKYLKKHVSLSIMKGMDKVVQKNYGSTKW